MQFRTEIHIPPSDFRVSHTEKAMTIGSCFAENISGCMQRSGFNVDCNPFGIVYNPLSVSRSLYRLLRNEVFDLSDIFQEKGIYSSFWHHSRFSETDPDRFLSGINTCLNKSSAFLRSAKLLIVTFGTASVYFLKETGQPVSNCHKQPADRFIRRRLTCAEIVSDWQGLLTDLQTVNPELRVLFTVSPIRHWKDGAHENQLSKSTLLLAVDEIIRENSFCSYFPSYELLLDDLRDYRFYADDLLHPSVQAIDYIWEKFSACFFTPETETVIREWESIQRDLNHKPFHPESEAYLHFYGKAKESERNFKERYGFAD